MLGTGSEILEKLLQTVESFGFEIWVFGTACWVFGTTWVFGTVCWVFGTRSWVFGTRSWVFGSAVGEIPTWCNPPPLHLLVLHPLPPNKMWLRLPNGMMMMIDDEREGDM